MFVASKAIFLSYASQDAEAARRICGALRAAGVEVWFDQNELVGGDAWDQKIRGQVKACALFVPLISANTQARLEGYFRIEWKLAAQRTHAMAEAKPFLLPVVIDETRDADAHVPGEFLAVQWTRLADGQPTSAFVTRVANVLAGSTVTTRAGDAIPDISVQSVSVSPRKPAVPRRAAAVLVGCALVLGLIAFLTLRPPAENVSSRKVANPNADTLRSPASAAQPLGESNSKTIAVLPFVNLSDDKENTAFFADGMHEDILTNLANIRDLRVVSRTSVMDYRGTTKKIPQIAQELGVAYILEGSVRRAGSQVRITGQLIRAAHDEHLWAKSYDRELTPKEVFSIQAALATEIAAALHAAISPAARKRLDRRPTESLAAYDSYLKGMAESSAGARVSEHRMQNVVRHLDAAVAADANFAEAWAELGVVHARYLFHYFDHTAERRRVADAAIAHALRLAPESPDVIQAVGSYAYFGYGDYARATAQFERVLQLQPNNAYAVARLAGVQRMQGNLEQSLPGLRKAAEIEPRNLDIAGNLITSLVMARRWDEARSETHRVIALHPEALEFPVPSGRHRVQCDGLDPRSG